MAHSIAIVIRRLAPSGSLAGAIVLGATIPLLFVIYNSWQLQTSQWLNLWSSRLPQLLWNTLSLAVLVAIGCAVLGVSAAWWITRREFPGRRLAVWLMVLPLTIPTYVFAHIYTSMLEQDGWLGRVWLFIFGNHSTIPDLYNIVGVTAVLSLAGFSYVFLLARSALSQSSKSLEEAARIQGASQTQVFWSINLPLLRPAIAAALAVVVLHVLSDFGAVSMLRYQTFTLSIYLQMSGRFDYQAAAGLSLILVILSLTFLVLERFFRNQQRYYSGRQSRRTSARPATAFETVLIWLWLGIITLLSSALPIAWMISWTLEAWSQHLITSAFWQYAFNSLTIAIAAACVAVICGLPIALFNVRKRSRLSQAFIHLSSVGFVLPGPVIALGMLSFILAQLPFLYGGFIALLIALAIRFLPLAVQSQDASLQQLTPSIEQAGRNLGAGPLANLWYVILPMIRTGMSTAWVLVFIDTLKELPATLILRPTGFDTLPVRIWIEASEEMLELAAPAALALVFGTLPVLWIMLRSRKFD